MKPLLIGFIGFPGSGKTTFARRLAKEIGAVTYNSDALRLSMFGSLDRIEEIRQRDRSRLYEDVFGSMNYATAQALKAGHSVIYDAQMAKRVDRERLSKLAEQNGARFVLVWIKTDPAVAKQRGQNRENRSDSHQYSPEKMEMLVERFSKVNELPESDEDYVEVSGEVAFDEQYAVFSRHIEG